MTKHYASTNPIEQSVLLRIVQPGCAAKAFCSNLAISYDVKLKLALDYTLKNSKVIIAEDQVNEKASDYRKRFRSCFC